MVLGWSVLEMVSFRVVYICFASFLLVSCQTQITKTPPLGKSFESIETVSLDTWLAQSPIPIPLFQDSLMDAGDVAYVLRKTGFDSAPSEVELWIGKNRSELIKFLLDGLTTRPIVDPPKWTLSQPRYWGQRDWPEPRKSAFRSSRRQEVGELRQWWIKQMLATSSPLGERLVLMWENTFVAGFSGMDNKSHAQWLHHRTIRERSLGNYRDLILSMLQDPAVLIYLDNNRNKKESPNENLARELLELYTLGESNYTERDIKEAARTLAGWHVSEFGEIKFQEKSWARDYGNKSIFGETGRFDGEDLVDLILRHPAAAEYVSLRFWKEFVSTDPMPDEVKQAWADGFRRSGYEVKSLLNIVLGSEVFWDPKYRATSVKSPIEFLIGSLRFAQTDKLPISVIDSSLSAMGQTLFDPPDVSGWGYGEYWLDPRFLIERERVQRLINQNFTDGLMISNAWRDESKRRTIRLKLAGEAYKGPPQYRVMVKHSGGSWMSSEMLLQSARDTERLGRYKDESQWVWDTVSVDLPPEVGSVTSISVMFARDASGNGGDRNLFVGAVEFDGTVVPGATGIQYPGCRKDRKAGFIKHPDRLYCQGAIEYDWFAATAPKKTTESTSRLSENELTTKELVLLWLKPPSKGEWQGVDLMFDGLGYRGQYWDYFGFELAVDTRKGWYQLTIHEDRCQPSCFEKWPAEVWKDKTGLRHLNVHLNNHESWAREQFDGLTKGDRELVKAILSTASVVRELARQTESHQEPGSKEIWDERILGFIDHAENASWRLDAKPSLVQSQLSSSVDINSISAIGQMSMMSLTSDTYDKVKQIQATPEDWHKSLETFLVLASEPIENWALSAYEGDRIVEMQSVILSPYWNLK